MTKNANFAKYLKQKRETFNRLEKEADLKIQKIKDEKEAERLRRIKKADYDSETERNRRNQEYLEGLKKNQEVVGGNDTAPKNKEGESTNNPNAIIDIPIIKKLTDVSAGYYLVLKTYKFELYFLLFTYYFITHIFFLNYGIRYSNDLKGLC